MDLFDKLANNEWDAWTAIASRINNENSKFQWDKKIYAEARKTLSLMSDSLYDEDKEEMLEYFLWAFQTFRQLDFDIDSLLYGGVKRDLRVRSLLLPLCTSLIEGCFVNLVRALIPGLSNVSGRNYREQSGLRSLVNVLNGNGCLELSKIPNVGLRNAISHGGVMLRSGAGPSAIEYTYTSGKERFHDSMSLYQLEELVLRYLDAVCGLMLAFCSFFNDIGAADLFSSIKDSFIRNMYIGFELSDQNYICLNVSEPVGASQVNYTFSTTVADDSSLFEKAEILFVRIRERCPDYEKYLITYSHPRMLANFMRVRGTDIDKYAANAKHCGSLIDGIIESRDILRPCISSEVINEYEAQYYRFPFYDAGNLKIYDVADVSTEDSKRLKANVFVGDIEEKGDLIVVIKKAIDWVKRLYNPPNSGMRIKHGTMMSDCVYLSVFRSCRSRDRSLLENNENFVCQVEYCLTAEFRLTDDNRYLKYLYRNKEWFNNELKILWREKKYLQVASRAKIGRNKPCPCGSGLKYKKCCGRYKD